ncbi:MAG: hypothetical protein BECKG1743F_GA0114225_111923 [Candidatus Kentron sp. G]|nr:MAG: hypothetical protein BECKG1743F_GA0114225_111923 [Candidatus Kentron sp. G]
MEVNSHYWKSSGVDRIRLISKARRSISDKAIGRKEYTELRRIFVRIQGARQAHRSLCNCYCALKPNKILRNLGKLFWLLLGFRLMFRNLGNTISRATIPGRILNESPSE